MSEIQSAMTIIGNTIGLEKMEVMENIITMNKNKAYPFSLIDIKIDENGVTDNADFIGEIVAKLRVSVNDAIKNDLDVAVILELKKTILEIGKFTKETRKIQTAPLKNIIGHYTPHEAEFDKMGADLASHLDKMNEVEYKKRETSIKEYFMELLKADGLTETISLDVFVDFVSAKRKTQIYTSKVGVLNGKIKGEIENALRLVTEPLREAKEIESKKSQESKQFEMYMENFNGDGDDSEKLGAIINQLIKFKESVPSLYPNVIEACTRSIDNKIALIEANIKANKSIAEKDAIKNADGEFMAMFDEINTMSQDLTLDIDSLKELANQLRTIYPKMKFTENQEKIKELGASLNQRVTDLEIEMFTPVVEVPETAVATEPPAKLEPFEEPVADSTEQETYIVSVHDFDALAGMELTAGSEDEAKEQLVGRFKAHLSMIQLVKKGK